MLRVIWQGPRALQILRFAAHTYGHYPLCALCSCTQYVGKGRQQAARIIELSDHRYIRMISTLQCAGYVLYRALVKSATIFGLASSPALRA